MYASVFIIKKGNLTTRLDAEINQMQALILYYVTEGILQKNIPGKVYLSKSAVKTHFRNLYYITGVEIRNAAALAGWVARHNKYDAILAVAMRFEKYKHF